MSESETDVKGGRPMAGDKGRMPWPAVAALLVIALGIVAVTLRHRVTVIDGTVLLLERWSGHVTFINRDGRISRLEGKNPGQRGLPDFFKSGVRETGKKIASLPAGKSAKTANAKTRGKPASGVRPVSAKDDAAVASPRRPASPFGSGAVTSKVLPGTGVKVYSSLKWEGEQGRFQLAIRPYTDEVKKLRRSKKSTFRIDLLDGKGAAVVSLTIPVDDMKPARDDNKKITALEYTGGLPLGREDFRTIQDWNIK
jgi:hypothetical protein